MIGRYKVIGSRRYRGHAPGATFEVLLDTATETRAISRGDIKLIRRVAPGLKPGSYEFPRGWLSPADSTRQRGRESGLSHSGR